MKSIHSEIRTQISKIFQIKNQILETDTRIYEETIIELLITNTFQDKNVLQTRKIEHIWKTYYNTLTFSNDKYYTLTTKKNDNTLNN